MIKTRGKHFLRFVYCSMEEEVLYGHFFAFMIEEGALMSMEEATVRNFLNALRFEIANLKRDILVLERADFPTAKLEILADITTKVVKGLEIAFRTKENSSLWK